MFTGKKALSVMFRIAASAIVVLLGAVFLFPETALPAIKGKVMSSNNRYKQTTPELASMNKAFERPPMTQERVIAADNARIVYKTEFVPGSLSKAVVKLEADMENGGYSRLKTRANTDGMNIFVRGKEFLGVRFIPDKRGTVITYCKLSLARNPSATKVPVEIKEIVYGKPVALFNSGNGNPVFVTSTTSGVIRSADRIREKLKNNGWEIIEVPPVPQENGLIMIMARRGKIFCDVAIVRTGQENGEGNSITYKITHM